MAGKKTPTKRKTEADAAANARSTRGARSTLKTRRTETQLERQPITQRDLEIGEYAKAMGFFAEQRYEVARPLFLRLTAAETVTLRILRGRVCGCVTNALRRPR